MPASNIVRRHQESHYLESCHMESNKPTPARRPAGINKHPPNARNPSAIRFSESEWEQIRIAASKRGISFGSFVREAALTHAAADNPLDSAALPPEIVELMRHTFRYACTLTTMKRNDLIRAGHRDEVNKAAEFARKAEAELTAGL